MGWNILSDEAAEFDRQQSNFPWKNKGIQWRYMQEYNMQYRFCGVADVGMLSMRLNAPFLQLSLSINVIDLDSSEENGDHENAIVHKEAAKKAHCKRSMLDTVSYQWSGCDFPEQWSMLKKQLLSQPMILSKLLNPAKHRSCPVFQI